MASPRTPTGEAGHGHGHHSPTLMDLVDLALCTPEVGAVNFNILRILLRDIIEKTGIDKKHAKVNDVEAGQVENYRNYVQGSGAVTPGPGVLKIGPGRATPPSPGGHSGRASPVEGGPQQTPRQHTGQSQGQTEGQSQQQQTPRTQRTSQNSPNQQHWQQPQYYYNDSGETADLADKVARLEKTLDGLYQLPANQEIIERAKSGAVGAMSVNDMWQIIQLNNRIAAAEAAIQKMASLIEDLAKGMGKVKSDTKIIKDEMEFDLNIRKSDLHEQGKELTGKYEKVEDVVRRLQKDMENLKRFWKRDRENIELALGTPLNQVPTFMKDKEKKGKGTGIGVETGTGVRSDAEEAYDSPNSEQYERGTQTFIHAKGKDRKSLAEAERRRRAQQQQAQGKEDSSRQDQQHKPTQQEGAQHSEKSEAKPGRQSMKPPPKPRSTKGPEDLTLTPPEVIAKMTPAQILEKITPEEARRIPPEIYQTLSHDQKKALHEIKKSAAMTHHHHRPVGLDNMTRDEIQKIPLQKFEKMGYAEAANLSGDVLDSLTEIQRQKVQEILQRGAKTAAPKHGQTNMKQKLQEYRERDQKSSQKQEDIEEEDEEESPPRKSMGVATMEQDEIYNITAEDIENEMSWVEAKTLPPKVFKKMTPEQQEAVKKVVDSGPTPPPPPHPVHHHGQQTRSTSPKTLGESGGYEQYGGNYPPHDGHQQYPQQHTRPSKKKSELGIASMKREEIKELSAEEIIKEMPYDEAKNLPDEVLDNMSEEQKEAIQKVVEAGPEESFYDDVSEGWAEPPPPPPVHHHLPKPIRKSKSSSRRETRGDELRKPLTLEEIDELADMSPEQLATKITFDVADAIPEDEMEKHFTPMQIQEIEKIRKTHAADGTTTQSGTEGESYPEDEGWNEGDREESGKDEGTGTGGGGAKRRSFKDRPRALPARHRGKEKMMRKQLRLDRDAEVAEDAKDEMDHSKGPVTTGKPLPPMTLEEYLASLPPEEAANMAADAVQRELQKQYQHLQGMQRQLASDIQQKMEFIYQKLLKEIAAQNMSTSPFIAAGPDDCLGPGICAGHGMPAGIVVTQQTDSKDRKGSLQGHGGEGKACRGPGVCPGPDICPYCRADAKDQEALRSLRDSEKRYGPDGAPLQGVTGAAMGIPGELDETLLKEIKSLVMLDLEKLREEMRSRQLGAYDEQDILERLTAVWEALKILKTNEESIAIKMAKQDVLMKKIPDNAFDKLGSIPDDSWEALVTGNFGQAGQHQEEGKRKSTLKETEEVFTKSTGRGGKDTGKEDIQTLFNNLATVIAECTDHKEKIDQLADTARVLESGMVTKQMLTDALSDKADRGLINTKVSYDEFGSTIDELHHQLHNLMTEGLHRNENWKKVTSDLAEELSDKLDKVEIAPIRAFFKTNLKALEEKVKKLTAMVEEPDSAGTRKKLLRDMNCLSCDRMVNISGVTNGPTLPVLGPIPGGNQNSAKRALNLHKMRMMKRNPNVKGKLTGPQKTEPRGNKGGLTNPDEITNDMDIMRVINRYTGGSHTAVNVADIIAAQRRTPSLTPAVTNTGPIRRSNVDTNTGENMDSSGPAVSPEPLEQPPELTSLRGSTVSMEYMMEE